MPRFPQMKTFTDQEALRDHLEALGIEIPIDDEVDPTGALAAPRPSPTALWGERLWPIASPPYRWRAGTGWQTDGPRIW